MNDDLSIAGVGPGHRVLRPHRFLASSVPMPGEGADELAQLRADAISEQPRRIAPAPNKHQESA